MTDTLQSLIDTELPQPGGPATRMNRPWQRQGQIPSGEPVAPVAGHPEAPPSDLPPGTHPMDPSNAGPEGSLPPLERTGAPYKKGAKPFAQDNANAFPVNQRSAHDFRVGVVGVNTNNGGVSTVVGRRPGRRAVTLWIPSQLVVGGVLVTPSNGVMVSNTEGELQNGGGAYMAPGDSWTIESESSVQIGLAPGATSGFVQYKDEYDEPGGGITGNT